MEGRLLSMAWQIGVLMTRYIAFISITFFCLSTTVAFAAGKQTDATVFFHTFRHAVKSNNIEQVSTLTRFPFEVRGPDDSDPVRRFDRKGFPAILKRVLVQPVFVTADGKSVTKSMLQIVEEKRDLEEKDYDSPNFFRIEQFEFQRIRGRWAFTRAYLEE
jgi:hypothetical protein